MSDVLSDPLARKIVEAFRDDRDRWRTIGGVSRDTGLEAQEVEGFIAQHPDLFVPSDVSPNGSPLYSLREEIREQLELPGVDA